MAGAFSPAGTATPSSKVELRISCKNLRDTDVFSKSDPMVAVYTAGKRIKTWDEVRQLNRPVHVFMLPFSWSSMLALR